MSERQWAEREVEHEPTASYYLIHAAIGEQNACYVDFRVWVIIGGTGPDGSRLFEPAEGHGWIEDRSKAQVYMHGSVKWDGCSDVHYDEQDSCMLHFCGIECVEAITTLMRGVYALAAELMTKAGTRIEASAFGLTVTIKTVPA